MVLVQRLPLADWRLLTGVKLSRQRATGEAGFDPSRHFAAVNCRTAKGSFDHPSAGSSNAQRMIGMRVRQLERVGDGAISDVAAVHI